MKNILIIDDNPDDRFLYKKLLRNSQCYFEEAETGEEGMDLLSNNEYDAVILDYMMPDCSGLEFLQMVHENKLIDKAPIVMITGNGNEDVAISAIGYGITDYITKDTFYKNREELVKAINSSQQKFRLKLQVKQVNRELRLKNLDANKLNNRLKLLIRTLAHDILNPLGGIRMILDIHGATKKLDGKYFDIVYQENEGAISRIKSFIDEQQTALDIKCPLTHIVPVVDQALQMHKTLIKKTQALVQTSLTVDEFPIGYTALKSIIENFLSNALKYQHSKRPTEIVIFSSQENGTIKFGVKDNGLGIDLKQNRERLFEPFSRFSPEIEGNGIGLSNVKHLVENCNGKVHVESELGKGSTFFVTFKTEDLKRKMKNSNNQQSTLNN